MPSNVSRETFDTIKPTNPATKKDESNLQHCRQRVLTLATFTQSTLLVLCSYTLNWLISLLAGINHFQYHSFEDTDNLIKIISQQADTQPQYKKTPFSEKCSYRLIFKLEGCISIFQSSFAFLCHCIQMVLLRIRSSYKISPCP